MKAQIQIAIVAAIVSVLFGLSANAQELRVAPQVQQIQPFVQPVQQNPFYFGMNVVLKRNSWGRTTLQVVSVTPGSPAHQAGLEYGDEIRRVNGRGFRFANDSFDAVRMMNQFVVAPVIGGPASAPAVAAGVQALIMPSPQPNPIARMVVRNVRNGQDVIVNVRPTRIGGAPGAPAVAAAAVSAGG